ncbi:hypothetical protein LTS09_011977 [Friedmanniomyces endolithicus]|nr:hypothetical protein LTS09_011977 [Friedmanniomyces endolithicus]
MGDPGEMMDPVTNPKLKRELREYGKRGRTDGPYADNLEVDALVVGGGFAGVFMFYTLRKAGLKTVMYEAGTDLGGTWRWNCYPGAMVDSEVPEYQLSIPETWKTYNWPNNYPGYKELRDYFDHCDKVLDIKSQTAFDQHRRGPLVPPWEGIDKFKGIVHHSSFWPDEEIDVTGKRCGIIGTGASGVQITQAWGPKAAHLKVFQRTPNLTVPMRLRKLSAEEQEEAKRWYPELFDLRERCFGGQGFVYDFCERSTFEDSEEEREKFFEKLWADGGVRMIVSHVCEDRDKLTSNQFRYWLGNYKDYLFDAKANRVVYDFWAKKQRARINDPAKRDILAPLEPPHPWGVKRPCLEHSYFEQYNRDNVEPVSLKGRTIECFNETGIKLSDGSQHDFDIICIATGFDVVTGGMTAMGLHSINGESLESQWKKSAHTYLGTTVSGYPNQFHIYGPQGPTLLSNGPTSVEVQGRWIADVIKKCETEGIKYINPTDEASKEWKKRINYLSELTLMPTTKSTYMGGSDPNKAFEQTCYAGGLYAYGKEIRAVLPDLKGFDIVKA